MARHSYSRNNRGDDPPKTKITRETLREAAGLFGYIWPYRFRFERGGGAGILSAGRWRRVVVAPSIAAGATARAQDDQRKGGDGERRWAAPGYPPGPT
jgi:hypothetical protein